MPSPHEYGRPSRHGMPEGVEGSPAVPPLPTGWAEGDRGVRHARPAPPASAAPDDAYSYDPASYGGTTYNPPPDGPPPFDARPAAPFGPPGRPRSAGEEPAVGGPAGPGAPEAGASFPAHAQGAAPQGRSVPPGPVSSPHTSGSPQGPGPSGQRPPAAPRPPGPAAGARPSGPPAPEPARAPETARGSGWLPGVAPDATPKPGSNADAGSNAGARSEATAARPSAGRPDRGASRRHEPDEEHDPRDGRGDHDEPADPDAPGTSADPDDGAPTNGTKKRKGSFWRELPLLILVAIVLTFVIQTFVARIYVIPSASMEQTLHGCSGCTNDRVAVDKVTYRFTDPAPGDVVVFRGPPAWRENDEVATDQPSGNPLVRGVTDALSLVGLASPNEKDFVKRVIAVGGQTVACCDAQNHVTVDGRPLDETYLYFQSGTPPMQEVFEPVVVPQGQLWVMGDNRNNSADARFHGPIGVTDVIGQARVVVLPVPRWGAVSSVDPQVQASALGAPGWTTPAMGGTALLLAVPVVGLRRRLRGRLLLGRDQGRGAEPGGGRRTGRRR